MCAKGRREGKRRNSTSILLPALPPSLRIACYILQGLPFFLSTVAVIDMSGLLYIHVKVSRSIRWQLQISIAYCTTTLLNRYRYTVPFQYDLVSYLNNAVEYHPDSIVFMDRLESIRYLQYWNVNVIEPQSNQYRIQYWNRTESSTLSEQDRKFLGV